MMINTAQKNEFLQMVNDYCNRAKVTDVTFYKKAITSTYQVTGIAKDICQWSGKAEAYVVKDGKTIGEAFLERNVATKGGNDFNHCLYGGVSFGLKTYGSNGGYFQTEINVKKFATDLDSWISEISDHTGRNPQQVREIVAKITAVLDECAVKI
jgi:hypothetical protein